MNYTCTSNKFDNDPSNRYASATDFADMCEACFGERVELTTPDGGDTYENADGEIVLRRVRETLADRLASDHVTESSEALDEALASTRVPWQAIDAAGFDIQSIADDARWHGDSALYRRAMAYLRRAARGALLSEAQHV